MLLLNFGTTALWCVLTYHYVSVCIILLNSSYFVNGTVFPEHEGGDASFICNDISEYRTEERGRVKKM